MTAWETIVAAVGGLLLGLGLGLSLGRRAATAALADCEAAGARIRTSVLPVLEQRVTELGIEAAPSIDSKSDPVGAAVSLATAIRRSDHGRELALSDTVEMEARAHVARTVSQRPPRR